ncbi:VCP-like ATPase [uncultured archaeon]|nr:VCP-like ATPase [uncultured archaeon]
MKINRIGVSVFVVSAEIEDSLNKLCVGKDVKMVKEYVPLLSVRLMRLKGKSEEENRFFVNLVNKSIYTVVRPGYASKVKGLLPFHHAVEEPSLDAQNFLSVLESLPQPVQQAFGFLVDHGTTSVAEFKQEDLAPLLHQQLVDTYQHQATVYVKLSSRVPSFSNACHDLSRYFVVSDTSDGSIECQSIHHNPEAIAKTIGSTFGAVAQIEKVVYLPVAYIHEHIAGKTSVAQHYLMLNKASGQHPASVSHPKNMAPIMLGAHAGAKEIAFEAATINFTHVAGMDAVKERIREAIVYPLKSPDVSSEYQKKGGGSILFYGPPGCGKTYIVRATVGECGANFYSVNANEIIGMEPQVGADNLHNQFEDARANTPAIIFFDEIDALGGRRESAQSTSSRMVINQFLTEMDGVESSNINLLVIGSTNAPWDIDPALRRSGRFTIQILLPPPDKVAREAIFSVHLKKVPHDGSVDVGKLADLTDGYSSADIKAICDESVRIPWQEAVHGGVHRPTTMKDFLTVLASRKSSLVPWMRLAEKQISKSGESDVYAELWDLIEQYKARLGVAAAPEVVLSAPVKISPPPATPPVQSADAPVEKSRVPDAERATAIKEKNTLDEKIRLLKEKKEAGEINDSIYAALMAKFESQLKELGEKI